MYTIEVPTWRRQRPLIQCLMFIISLLVPMGVTAESKDDFNWIVVSTDDEITVYEAKEKHSGIVPIRFNATLDYPTSRVRAVLADTKRRPEWTPNMVEARILEMTGTGVKFEYLRYKFPWPFMNRTFVLHNKNTYNPADKSLLSTTHSITHPNAPETKKHIRGHTFAGNVLSRPVQGGEKTYLEAVFLTDVRGDIPKWLFNLIQRSWPRKIIKGLNRQLARDDIKVEEKWLLLDQ